MAKGWKHGSRITDMWLSVDWLLARRCETRISEAKVWAVISVTARTDLLRLSAPGTDERTVRTAAGRNVTSHILTGITVTLTL